MFRFASHILVAVLLLSVALAETPAVVDSVDTTARLTYVPKFCYKRIQICCYKYVPCGRFCKVFKCRTVRKCVRYLGHKCIRYKTVKICIHRCYTKLCLRWRCGRFVVSRRFRLKSTKKSKHFTTKKTRKTIH